VSRKVIYISGTRADFGLMALTLQTMKADLRLDVGVLATGMHLDDRYGGTWRDIEAAGVPIVSRVLVDVATRSRESMSQGLGDSIVGMTRELARLKPDAVLVLGDRGEMLAAALVCLHLGIPVFHIHGGERSGTIDEPIRHCVSRLATWHLVATSGSRERLIRMGERPDSIVICGAPGLDGFVELAEPDSHALLRRFGLNPDSAFVLVVFHPVVQQAEEAAEQTQSLADALIALGLPVLWIAPNSDAGSGAIADKLAEFASSIRDLSIQSHLSRADFSTAIRHCAVMVGNSSSGILEAASFGTPVVNVGDRQKHRERNDNVYDCAYGTQEISEALRQAISHGIYPAENLYGSGVARQIITETLATASLDRSLLAKVNYY
jgi:GDP/UDP-N,N'-diacetylbacillosamine 2-epimerase (hydrolysing)